MHMMAHDGAGDNSLRAWDEWLATRRQVFEKLSRDLGRPTGDLIMNTAETGRSVKEDKLVLEYTNIETNFDKYRGNPVFWNLPLALPDKCGRGYFAVETKQQQNIVPSVDYVGLSDCIKEEKNLLPYTRLLNKLWQDSTYRQEKLRQCNSKLTLIQPHRPEMEQLAIKGVKIHPKAATSDNNDTDLKTNELQGNNILFNNCETDVKSPTQPRLCFTINGFKMDETSDQTDAQSKKIFIRFEDYQVESDFLAKQYLVIENQGKCVLRFNWEEYEKFRQFRNEAEASRSNNLNNGSFYFNKNEFLLLPGKTINFPVWFKTELPGNYSELWEIKTKPKLWNDDFRLIVYLQCNACICNLDEYAESITAMLNARARNRLIQEAINDMLKMIDYSDVPLLPCRFDEKLLFEAANYDKIRDRSMYLYNAKVVGELSELFNEVRRETGAQWNYSVETLRILAKDKDVFDYNICRSEMIQSREKRIGRNENTANKKSAKVGKSKSPKSKSKKKSTDSKKSKNKPPPAIESPTRVMDKCDQIILINSNKLEDLVQRLERAEMIKNDEEREKHFYSFTILSSYFTRMCILINALQCNMNLSIQTNYPKSKVILSPFDNQPERLIYEYFDDSALRKTTLDTLDGQPKTDVLANIPQEDIQAIHAVYFNVSKAKNDKKSGKKDKKSGKKDKSPSSKQTKSAAKSKSGKASKSKSLSKKTTTPRRPPSSVIKRFDPYAETFEIAENLLMVNESTTSGACIRASNGDGGSEDGSIEFYQYNLFVIVYSCLANAIDAITETLDTYKVCTAPRKALKIFSNADMASSGQKHCGDS